MVAYIFQRLVDQGAPASKDVSTSRDWFRSHTVNISPQNILRSPDPEQHTMPRFRKKLRPGRFEVGRMVTFQYDPKGKDALPYYDIYPLVFVIDVDREGFLGLNLHYLPPVLRAKLMDGLWDFVPKHQDETLEDTDKLSGQMTFKPYQTLKRIRSLRYFRPCLKRYLNSNVMSRLVQIYPDEWNNAVFLPTQRFKKKGPSTVYKDSYAKIRKTH